MLRQPGGVPANVNRIALEIGHGEDLANDFFQDIRRRYLGESTAGPGQPSNAFDRNGGDIDAWFKRLTQERERALPSDAVRSGFNRRMLGFQQRLYAEHDQYLGQRTLQANLDAAHGAFYGIATDAIRAGERDPKVIHQRMQAAIPRIQQLHLVTPQQANAALFSAARAIAQQGIPGNPQLAVAIVREVLLGARTGTNGQTLAPLGASNEYAHLTNQVIEAAQRVAGEHQRKLDTQTIVKFREEAGNGRLNEEAFNRFIDDNPHVMGPSTQAHREAILLQNREAVARARQAQTEIAERLARQAASDASEAELNLFLQRRGDEGTLQTVPERMRTVKPNGETHEIQRQNLLDRARDNELARIQEWGRQTAEFERDLSMGGVVAPGTPTIEQRVFDRTYEFLNRNGLEHPQWRDTLAGGYAAATPAAVSGAQPPPILSEATRLYETLEARAPGMLERHLASQSARDFYRTYRIGRTSLRMDERQAMVFATTATADVGADDSRAPSLDKIEKALQYGDSFWLYPLQIARDAFWPWGETVSNYGDMRSDVSRLTRVLVRGGMNPDAALNLAVEDVRKQYTSINGFMVRTGDRVIESYGALLTNAGLQPRTFQDSVQRYLERYATENPEAVDATTEPSGTPPALIPSIAGAALPRGTTTTAGRRLSIRPTPNSTGVWTIIDTTTGVPVPSGSENMRQTITLRDLLGFEQRTQTEERDREAKRLSEETRRSQENARRAGAPGTVPRRTPRLRQRGWPEDDPNE
jgi:hypothetical protein